MNHATPSTLPIVILAAGQSSRMRGRDKLMEPVDGVPLLRRQAGIARAATTGPVIVTLPPRPHPRYGALAGCPVTVRPVPDAATGMSASLRAGLSTVPPDCPAAMVMLADLPDLTAQDLRHMCAAVDLASGTLIWRGATAHGHAGHPIIFAASVFGELRALSGDTGGAEVVARHRAHLTLVPLPGERARCDLDTPEEWTAWRAARVDR